MAGSYSRNGGSATAETLLAEARIGLPPKQTGHASLIELTRISLEYRETSAVAMGAVVSGMEEWSEDCAEKV
jgi:hypothetical protein